jgi:hypothetical protein
MPRPLAGTRPAAARPMRLGAFLGPALAGVVTFVVWGGLALAVGTRGRLALAIAVVSSAYALVWTAVIAFADVRAEDARADGDAVGTSSGPRQRYLPTRQERRLSSAR